MNSDPLSSFLSPPTKRRKLMAVLMSPPKLSDLMAAFGATTSPMSTTRMDKGPNVTGSRQTRPPKRFSYAESDSSSKNVTPENSPGTGSFQDSPESPNKSITESEDELQQNDSMVGEDGKEDELQSHDVIHVASQSLATRELPKRSTKTRVSYATPKRPVKKKTISMGREKQESLKLTSDLATNANSKTSKSQPYVETERNKVRNDIRTHTKPKRDAFLLANQEYFLPLLPETSYIDKLQRLQNLREEEDVEVVPYTSMDSQPMGVQAIVKPYQLEGLSYLVYMYENGMSAILGDEMGLGKTLQTLTLFQYLINNEPMKGETRPFLVVCPLSVLSSWMAESKKWVPNLNVVRLHGPKAEREKLKEDCRHAGKASTIDVIVTTYETFVAEAGWFKRAFVWRYCVLDEGHKIKNNKSNVSHALQTISSEYRLLLTGTPLQNNLHEMWALLHWLYPEVFTEETSDNFKQAFDLTKGKASTTFMNDARRLLEVIMLRRMKNTPGVNLGLPPKEEILLYVPLTPMQRFWYTRLLTKADNMILNELFKGAKGKEVKALEQEADDQKKHLGILELAAEQVSDGNALHNDVWAESKEIVQNAVQSEEADTKSNEWRKLMNLIMQLRKVCSHPYLMPHAQPEPYYLGDHVKTASGKFIVLDKLIEELALKQDKKILIFAGFTSTLDLCEDLLVLKGGSTNSSSAIFRYMRLDGGTGRAKRNLGIRMFNNTESDCKIMLISTRAGGLGINLASASNVVFMDEDWNPQVTLQAEARAHRIGQTQKVTVYKLCTQGTVEEQMMGRIRKKLYLSAKITESMRNIHATDGRGKKRKRDAGMEIAEEAPHLDASSLKSLIRRGAQTLSRPEVDITEMLSWDWNTTLEHCKDKPVDMKTTIDGEDVDEQSWLNSMEKVECAVFEGKKHQKAVDKAAAQAIDLVRSDRRVGKNTTVMIDGFAINKESLTCADWEAVPTMAGKDPRLAEPEKRKKVTINHQETCQCCWEDGQVVLCSGCPRIYHLKCLDPTFQKKARGSMFHCPQHECVDCQSKTSDAGGLIYRCRWCANGYCEDCLDWDTTKLLGSNLPEYEMLGVGANDNAWYIECSGCIKMGEVDEEDATRVKNERARIQGEYESLLDKSMSVEAESMIDDTPATISEVGTPIDLEMPQAKKPKMF